MIDNQKLMESIFQLPRLSDGYKLMILGMNFLRTIFSKAGDLCLIPLSNRVFAYLIFIFM